MISTYSSHVNAVVRFVRCMFYLNIIGRSSTQALLDIYTYQTTGNCDSLFSSSVILDTCTFHRNYGVVLRAYSDYNTTKILLLGDVYISCTIDYTGCLMYFKNTAVYMNGTITIFNNRVQSLFLFFSCTVVINGNFKVTANLNSNVFSLKINTRHIEVEEYTNITLSDIAYPSRLITISTQKIFQSF